MRYMAGFFTLLLLGGCGAVGGGGGMTPTETETCLSELGLAYVVFDRAETDTEKEVAQEALVEAAMGCAVTAGASLDLDAVTPSAAMLVLVAELLPEEPVDRIELYAKLLTLAIRGSMVDGEGIEP